jgi:hypothetical protein
MPLRRPPLAGSADRRYETFQREKKIMKDQVSRLLLLVLMSVLPGSVLADDPPALVANPPMPAAKPAAAPRIKDRVYPKDLEGIWMASRYLEALKAARSPHAAAAKARPLVITI